MRKLLVAVAALGFACGQDKSASSPPPPSGSGGPPAQQFVLAVSTQGDGMVKGLTTDCRGACTQRYDAGISVTLHAVADSGATFDGWTGACSGTGDCTLTMSADSSVAAAFGRHVKPQHQLTVLVDGQGSVQSSPGGIDCGTTCAAPFDEGASVTLTATAASGWQLTSFSGACTGTGGCSVTMSADALVRVKFDALPPPPPPPPPAMVSLTVHVDGKGEVDGPGFGGGGYFCDSTCTTQVQLGSRITLTTTASAGWRFMGFSGSCSGAVCSFTANSNSSLTATFEQEVIALAPSDGTNSNVLAINSTHVFFQREGSGIYGIWSVPKAGGSASLVTSFCCASALTADDQYVYWATYSGIGRAPVGGGTAEEVHTVYAVGGFALDGANLFWTNLYSYGPSGTPVGIYMGPAAGGSPGMLMANATGPRAIAVDAQNIYFTDKDYSSNPSGEGLIRRVPRAGGPVTTVIDCGNCSPAALRLDFDTIYYRNSDGDLWAHPKNGSTFTQLNTGNPRNGLVFNPDFDVNAKTGYWTWSNNTEPSGLYKANADGTGWTAIETGGVNDQTWWGPRVDDNSIYYLHAGALYRRLK